MNRLSSCFKKSLSDMEQPTIEAPKPKVEVPRAEKPSPVERGIKGGKGGKLLAKVISKAITPDEALHKLFPLRTV